MNDLRTRIVNGLASLGWNPRDSRPFPGLASRDFETAVGIRTASIELRKWSDGITLRGLYYSEGGNALSTVWHAPLQETTSETDITKTLRAFHAEVIDTVNQTYARRLHLQALVAA